MKRFLEVMGIGLRNRTKYFWLMIRIICFGFLVDLIIILSISQNIIMIFIESYFALTLVALMVAWVYTSGESFEKHFKKN
jgi:cellulose synthase/poly-beta-1,6-N-acetylglucosamine synthase-like glycosyltransferase